ncbi:MAG: cupin domain-containing protein [Mangrovicoccus sp.]|nr:cupin domain-containing protein [Mangrovicoccus sp.]
MNDETPLTGPGAPNEADLHVGRRLRALRLKANLSQADVAQRAGISIGALSQIERGVSSLRVRTLWPLAAVLDVEPSQLLGADSGLNDIYCVRAGQRASLPVHSEGITKHLLSPPGAALTGIWVEIEPGGGTAEAYAHAGHEFGHVVEGEVELVIDGARYRLRQGDSFAFRSTLPHAFRNMGEGCCRILWVNTTRPSEVRDGD